MAAATDPAPRSGPSRSRMRGGGGPLEWMAASVSAVYAGFPWTSTEWFKYACGARVGRGDLATAVGMRRSIPRSPPPPHLEAVGVARQEVRHTARPAVRRASDTAAVGFSGGALGEPEGGPHERRFTASIVPQLF